MGIITKEVEVKPSGKMIKYYRDKGYNAKYQKSLIVKIEDLPKNSNLQIEVKCDNCGRIKTMKYADLTRCVTYNEDGKYYCIHCSYIKQQEVMMRKYGHKTPMQISKMKDKILNTNLEKYGYASPSQNEIVKAKQKQTFLEKYGVENPSQSKELQDKRKRTTLERFGVECVFHSPEIQQRIKETNLERYGVENVLLNKEIKEKRDKSLLERWGTLHPLQSEECRERWKNTTLERYGVEHISQPEEIKEKKKQTNLERYGYESIMQSPEFLEKWFAKNGSNFARTSAQQRYLCNLYNGILNYPFKCFALDIFLEEENIDIEFDGSGHRMSITLGSITEEDFEKKELYRNVALKKAGIKVMRIISLKDKLPSDKILLQLLSHSKEYFSEYPNHSWIEFDFDSSTVRNAEQPDGIFFNFGELRKIESVA